MTPERWAQIEELFHRAAECEPAQRTNLLDAACSSDPDLRREVDALLSSDRSTRDHVQSAVSDGLNDFAFSLGGEVVSHYRILDGLGAGGMGLVYRAEDIRLGRLVALKFLPEESANNPVALARFEREARVVSAVEHPNICPIYEFGEHEGRLFLVMQFLEGQTLRELLEDRRREESKPGVGAAAQRSISLPLVQVLGLAVQIADGLDAAHQKGIIHRDIKPANIFLTKDGHLKILDFGLAKLAENVSTPDDEVAANAGGGGMPARNDDPVLSRTGVALGTAAYMSPEQVRGEKLDARTDLFSFGLVLYEMATGQRAFVGDTGPILHAAILNQSPSAVQELNPTLPAKFETIVSKALEKDREARYPTVAEMRADIEGLKRDLGARRFIRWAGLAGAVALLLVASVSYWFAKGRTSAVATFPDVKLSQLTMSSSENPVKGGTISPDGKYLGYVDGKGLHFKKVGTDEAQSVAAPEGLNNSDVTWEVIPTTWFPDSKHFLVNAHPATEMNTEWSSRTTSIWEVSVSGGPPRKLRDHAIAWSVSPDGSLISFGTNTGKLGEREIWLMDANGQQPRRLYETSEDRAIGGLYFFPEGQRVSYISTDSSGDTLVARDLKGGPGTTLLPPDEQKKLGDPAWLSEGRIIYSDLCIGALAHPNAACNYWIMRMDTASGKVIEKPRRLTNWVGFTANGPSVTADGKQVAFLKSSAVGISYVADLQAGGRRLVNVKRFTEEEAGNDAIVTWVPGGKAVIVHSSHDVRFWLRKQALNSEGQETLVSSAPGYDEEVSISPDGKWLIVQRVTDPGGSSRLERIPISGGTPELILSMPGWSGSMCTPPPSSLCAVAEQTADHKHAVITSFDPVKGRGPELARLDLSPEYETTRMLVLWSISNDGTKLAFAPGPHGPIQIRSFGGGPTQFIRPKDVTKIRDLLWAADGKALFVANYTSGEIMYVDLHGDTTILWKCKTDRCWALPSPDGRHLAINDSSLTANIWMMENF